MSIRVLGNGVLEVETRNPQLARLLWDIKSLFHHLRMRILDDRTTIALTFLSFMAGVISTLVMESAAWIGLLQSAIVLVTIAIARILVLRVHVVVPGANRRNRAKSNPSLLWSLVRRL